MRARRCLLLIDNCEHLLDACARVVDTLLRACPQLQVLATSREALGVAGEVIHRVAPMGVPPLDSLPAVDDLRTYDSVQLFVARAQGFAPDFAMTERNAAPIGRICRQLDGIPLALELAAALVRALSVEDIAARLGRRFHLLTSGSRAALPRQQTLRATIDWSYNLLSAPEQTLFSRLSVFRGPLALEAAEEICLEDGTAPEQLLEFLLRLVDKSLVVAETVSVGSYRYRLLDTLREYGWERLVERREPDAILRKHASYFLTLADRAEPELNQPRQATWMERLASDQNDLLAALDWLVARGEIQSALRLANVLSRMWEVRGHLGEGRRRLAALLALPGAEAPTLARAAALHRAGVLALYQGDVRVARGLLKESLALYRHHQYPGVAWVLIHLGWLSHDSYRNKAARRFLEEALALCRQASDRRGIAMCLGVLGMVAVSDGHINMGRLMHEEALALSRELGDRWATAWALTNLGAALLAQVEVGLADAHSADVVLAEARATWEQLAERRHLAFVQVHLAMAAMQQDQFAVARDLLEESLSTFLELQDVGGTANNLANWAELFRTQARYEQCVELLAATYGQVKPSGRFSPLWTCIVERRLDTARRALGQRRFDAAWTQGYAMSMDEAIAYAAQNAGSIAPSARIPWRRTVSLLGEHESRLS
jgi:non-specific serine/threonine protein kinase